MFVQQKSTGIHKYKQNLLFESDGERSSTQLDTQTIGSCSLRLFVILGGAMALQSIATCFPLSLSLDLDTMSSYTHPSFGGKGGESTKLARARESTFRLPEALQFLRVFDSYFKKSLSPPRRSPPFSITHAREYKDYIPFAYTRDRDCIRIDDECVVKQSKSSRCCESILLFNPPHVDKFPRPVCPTLDTLLGCIYHQQYNQR